MAPRTQYAKRGEVSIAYQVVGDGPIDLILVNGIMAHMDLIWAEPKGNAALRQLASFSRLILFDKPGTGLSDPVAGAPTLEQRVSDITAVLEGSVRRGRTAKSQFAEPRSRGSIAGWCFARKAEAEVPACCKNPFG